MKKQSWNKKPQVRVNVFRFTGNFDVGFSGAPVCYEGNNNVVGVFTAKDNNFGYVIPIETILQKFEDEIRVSKPSQTVDTASIIDEGTKYYHTKDFYKAIEYFEKVIYDPNYVSAWYNKGLALDSLGKFDEAIQSYDKAIEIEPYRVEPRLNKGYALGKLGKIEEEIRCYESAIAIDPNSALVWYNKGTAFDRLGKSKEAIECYEKAIQKNPNFGQAEVNKGLSLYRLGEFNEAIESYEKMIEVDPSDAEAWANKAMALNNLGRHDEASNCYNKARQLGLII